MSVSVLTRETAQQLHDAAKAAGVMVIWLVSNDAPEHPGKIVARAHTADFAGGVYLSGALVADTLDELRALMPAGLTVYAREPFHVPEIVETWD
jgi:hypothetical protein